MSDFITDKSHPTSATVEEHIAPRPALLAGVLQALKEASVSLPFQNNTHSLNMIFTFNQDLQIAIEEIERLRAELDMSKATIRDLRQQLASAVKTEAVKR